MTEIVGIKFERESLSDAFVRVIYAFVRVMEARKVLGDIMADIIVLLISISVLFYIF
jgi:hypothetical protein